VPPRIIDKVGPWTEVKVEIVQEYATVFSKITQSKEYFRRIYIDGFAGGGLLLSETTGKIVESTPRRVLHVEPAFHEYHFIEKETAKVAALRLLESNPTVKVHDGDSNEILLRGVLPGMTRESYRKGLLFLDPYGLDVDWRVVEAAGQSRCVDLLLNFPIMDMNRKVLWTDPSGVEPAQAARMDRFWGAGGEGWREACYEREPGLFGDFPLRKKPGNVPAVNAYRKRLRDVAGFPHVSKALEMRNEEGAILYYLIGASQVPQAVRVFNSIFEKWRRKLGVRLV